MHAGYKLRGVEITASGKLLKIAGKWIFELDRTGEKLSLVGASIKIQKHLKSGVRWKATPAEKIAFAKLVGQWKGLALPVTLTGVLKQSSTADMPILEVSKMNSSKNRSISSLSSLKEIKTK